MKENATLPLCRIDAVPSDEGLRVEREGFAPVAVFRVGDEVFVIDDTCTHGHASLAEGMVEDGVVECPWHSGRFCLRTGEPVSYPAELPVRVHAVTVKDGVVHIPEDRSVA